MPLIAELLARRVRSDGAAPLVTYYGTDDGVRTELSATTFANWVAKTSNLLTWELDVTAGDRVELLVAARHPGHWMTLVWALACWQTGAVVTLGRPEGARLVVCGPDYADVEAGDAELVACSLHPFGLGLEPPVPAHVLDYAAEVRVQPDAWGGPAADAGAPAWEDGRTTLTQAELVAGGPAPGQRSLVRPGEGWATVHDALVAPLRDGGSSVVVDGPADEQRLARIGAAERWAS